MIDSAGGAGTTVRLRAEIARSWHRSRMCGVDPSAVAGSFAADGADRALRAGRFRRAAAPVVSDLFDHAAGTGVSFVLADRDCRIVGRWFDGGRAERRLDKGGVVPGVRYSEEDVGTNALGTALEVGRGIVINSTEHFLDSLKDFSCYGRPIRHPLTGRVEGVLDITAVSESANPLFLPLLDRAIGDIEQRLVEATRAEDGRLVYAFHEQSRRAGRGAVVLGFGAEIVLSSPRAHELVEPADHATLRGLAGELPPGGSGAVSVVLASGGSATAELTRIRGAGRGALVTVTPADKDSDPRPGRVRAGSDPVADPGGDGAARSIAVVGEPGSGVSTAASRLARLGDGRAVTFDASDADGSGSAPAWGVRLDAELRRSGEQGRADRAIVVEHADLLPESARRRLARTITAGREPGPRIIITTREASGLAALCERRVAVPPLRERRAEFAGIVSALIDGLDPSREVRLSAEAAATLLANPWPGNITELRSVLARIVAARGSGVAVVEDIPHEYRLHAGSRLGGMERAERAAVAAALDECGGNKRRAAQSLGISRTTLYARIRAFGLDRAP